MKTKNLLLGLFLLISFGVVLFLIFMPIFGDGKNGLEYTDDFFNRLAKGSSNYMNDMRKIAQPLVGTPVVAEITLGSPENAKKAEILFSQAGARVEAAGPVLKINGDLGKILLKAVDDAEALFNNRGEELRAKYHYNSKEVVKTWWVSLNNLAASLKKQKKFKQYKVVGEVQKRALEPGYNFFGVTPAKVADNAGMLTFLLVFYVVYTLWFGFGIYELFEGLGLSMEKPVSKEEV